jgi:hypothetical protein
MGEDLDGHADQYALAATAHHLLAGTPLFPHSNPAVVIRRHLTTPGPALADTHAELSALDPILATALAKHPDDRYRRCLDFARALAEIAATLDVVDRDAATKPAHAARKSAVMNQSPDHASRLWLLAAAVAPVLLPDRCDSTGLATAAATPTHQRRDTSHFGNSYELVASADTTAARHSDAAGPTADLRPGSHQAALYRPRIA